jgi:hypothetical protein
LRIKLLLVMAAATILYGCQQQGLPTEVSVIETGSSPILSVTPTATQLSKEWKFWSASAHAHVSDANTSSNTYCAKCHSPLNWDPASSVDTSSIVPREDWQGIGCEICHETNGKSVSASIAWWNQVTRQYDAVTGTTALCEQCHRDTEQFHYQVNLDNSVHSGFECVACHNPHTTTASCSNSGCHDGIRPKSSIPPSTPTGGQHPNNGGFCGGANCHPAATQAALSNYSVHGAIHASVSCMACHDASGMPVGPSVELGGWVTFQTKQIDGVEMTVPYESHDIQTQVDCSRCHFEGNPRGLPLVSGNEFGK